MPLPPNGKLIVNPDSIVVDDTNLNYTVGMATLVGGYINIAIFRKDVATNLTGKQIFESLVSYYINNKIVFNGIRGIWGGDSDNLKSFNSELIENQATPEQAATQTWTGKQTAKFGYTKANIVSMTPPEGPPYKHVKVVFSN